MQLSSCIKSPSTDWITRTLSMYQESVSFETSVLLANSCIFFFPFWGSCESAILTCICFCVNFFFQCSNHTRLVWMLPYSWNIVWKRQFISWVSTGCQLLRGLSRVWSVMRQSICRAEILLPSQRMYPCLPFAKLSPAGWSGLPAFSDICDNISRPRCGRMRAVMVWVPRCFPSCETRRLASRAGQI